jgi:hypothetical protein
MRYKDVLLATRSDLRDALMAGDTEKAERIYQECEAEYQKHQTAPQAECAPRVDADTATCQNCNGIGSHGGRFHIDDKGSSEYEPYKCDVCDGFGRVSADAGNDAALTNEKIEAAIEAWFDTDGKDVDDHQSRMRAAILAANKEAL